MAAGRRRSRQAAVQGAVAMVATALLVVPARASGETLTVSPARAAPGASVRLDYRTNYGPGGCESGQVVQLFFDASPLARAAMDPRTCGAVRTVRVPTGSCGRHVFRAAWRRGQDPTLYGEATAAITVPCTAPPPAAPSSRPRTHAPASRVTTAPPSPSAHPSAALTPTAAAPAVPVVTTSPSPAAAAGDSGSGPPWPLWALLGLGVGAGAAALLRRRSA